MLEDSSRPREDSELVFHMSRDVNGLIDGRSVGRGTQSTNPATLSSKLQGWSTLKLRVPGAKSLDMVGSLFFHRSFESSSFYPSA